MGIAVRDERFILTAEKLRGPMSLAIAYDDKRGPPSVG